MVALVTNQNFATYPYRFLGEKGHANTVGKHQILVFNRTGGGMECDKIRNLV